MPTQNELNSALSKRIDRLFNELQKDKLAHKFLKKDFINEYNSYVANNLCEHILDLIRELGGDHAYDVDVTDEFGITFEDLEDMSKINEMLFNTDITKLIGIEHYLMGDQCDREYPLLIASRLAFYEYYFDQLAQSTTAPMWEMLNTCFNSLCADALICIHQLLDESANEKEHKARRKGREIKKWKTTNAIIIKGLSELSNNQLICLAKCDKPYSRAKDIHDHLIHFCKEHDIDTKNVPSQKTIQRNWDEVWIKLQKEKGITMDTIK